jgi:hypothetical protein
MAPLGAGIGAGLVPCDVAEVCASARLTAWNTN